MRAVVVGMDGDMAGRRFPIGHAPVRFGRGEDNDIVIPDPAVVVWKGPAEGNVRRQQVVTIQSRQFRKLPQEIQDHLFTPGHFTEMWPTGPDSVDGIGPRNIRIAHVEDRLLDLANRKRGQIELIPEPFDAASAGSEIVTQDVLAICEGSRSRTFSHFKSKFGAADFTFTGSRASRSPTWCSACG